MLEINFDKVEKKNFGRSKHRKQRMVKVDFKLRSRTETPSKIEESGKTAGLFRHQDRFMDAQ